MKNPTEGFYPARKALPCFAAICATCLFLSGVWMGAAQPAEDAWNSPPFSLAPAELSKAALAVPVPAGTDDIILLDDVKYVFAEDGSHTYTSHFIFRILTPAGAKSWTTVQSPWRMWREEKPQIRARVITPDGVAHLLDPKTIGEAPVDDEQPDVFSDQRLVRAPLPAIDVGSVVEEEIVVPGKVSLLSNGSVHSYYFGNSVPTHRARMTIDAPAGLPLHFQTVLMDAVKPRRTESGGRVQLIFEGGPLDPFKDPEPLLPPDVPRWPQISFSTGKSWQDVANHYNEILEQQIRIPEVKTFAARANVGGKTRQESIVALLALLQKEIRYTGVEFGDASWIPRTPAETLKRKYGDCKDKASLLVAMLRSVGIPSHIALLNTSKQYETRPDLPGLGQFDHAIVFVPGPPEIWIDATDEYSRAGELPMMDQGRLALVIRPETMNLARVPESTSNDNRSVESREFYLAEMGPARIVETTEAHGAGESRFRSHYEETEQKEIQKQLKQYAEETYLSKEVPVSKYSTPTDLSVPFQLVLEMSKATRGNSVEREAVAVIFPSRFIDGFPSLKPDEEEETPSGTGSTATKGKPATRTRSGELMLPEPFVSEWNYKIVPPPGFRLRKLPENSEKKFGPSEFSSKFAVMQDGSVSASFWVNSGKRRMTASEALSMEAGVEELKKAEAIFIYFDQVGEVFLSEGKIRESLQEFKALASLHPKEPLHLTQIARALLAAGIGDSARETALRATKMDPGAAKPFAVLATILENDLVGRPYAKGFDLQGALAARRKEVALDPENSVAKANLAILLEYGTNGSRYSPGSKLDEAIEIYRSLGEKLKELTVTKNLAIDLMWMGRFQEMKDACSLISDNSSRLTLQIVATAGAEGANAALELAAKSQASDEARKTALRSAALTLANVRMYTPAAELMTAGAKGIQGAAGELARAEIYRKTRRKEESKPPNTDVRSVFTRLMDLFLSDELSEKELFDLLPRSASTEKRKKKQLENTKKVARTLQMYLERAGASPAVVLDVVYSSLQAALEGDDNIGYRLRAQTVGGSTQTLFASKVKDRYIILGVDNELDDVGAEVLTLLANGQEKEARVWLDRAREQLLLAGGDDPLSGRSFPRLWTKGQNGSLIQMRTAAAALMAPGDDPEAAVPVLKQSRAETTTDAEKLAIDLSLAEAYSKLEKWEELLEVSNRLTAASPESVTAFTYKTSALQNLKRWKECQSAAESRLRTLPDDLNALRTLRSVAEGQSNFATAADYTDRIISIGKVEEGDFNSKAWDSLVAETISDAALQAALQATQISKNNSFPSLHTLAAIHAEMGKTSEAREVLLHAMEVAGLEEPDTECWYVFGRIAEQFGETNAAVAAYKKVAPPEKGEPYPTSTYHLAKRRLDAIAKGSKK